MSAYKDGHEVVSKIRHKRRQRQAPPPAQILDESLLDAARDIETEKSRGVTRLGESFKRGDDVAILQLRQIRLELEAQLFRQLVQALRDDSVVDFGPALEASDLGRDHTVTALIQLRQRLMVAAPVEQVPAYHASPRSSNIPQITSGVGDFLYQTQSSVPAQHTFVETSGRVTEPQEIPDTSPESTGSRRKEGVSYFPSYSNLFRRKKNGDRAKPALDSSVQQRRPTQSPTTFTQAHENINRESTVPASIISTPPENHFLYPGEDGAAIWGSQFAPSRSSAESSSPPFASPPQSFSLSYHPTLNLPTPEASNNYLGFCKGAWKLQCGAEGALKRKLEFNNGWSSSEVPYLACGSAKCVFAYRLPLDQLEKVWHSSKGIGFRWSFLAKSHVEQSRVSNECYAYQCVFCALTGEKSTVWQGVDTFLTHVAAHRSETLPPEVLHRTKCIAGRVAGEDEGYDVNLKPPEKEAANPREDSFLNVEQSNPWRRSTETTDSAIWELPS